QRAPSSPVLQDVTAAGAGERGVDGAPGGQRPLAGTVLLELADPPAQPRVLAEVAEVAGHRLGVPREPLLVAACLAGQADDPAVGLELGEGALQGLPGLRVGQRPEEVDG